MSLIFSSFTSLTLKELLTFSSTKGKKDSDLTIRKYDLSHSLYRLYPLLKPLYSDGPAVCLVSVVMHHIRHDRSNEMGFVALPAIHVPSCSLNLHGLMLVLLSLC